MEHGRRRLSDQILAALNRACDDRRLQVADLLMSALEITLTAEGGAGRADQRKNTDEVSAAYARLAALRAEAQS